MTSPCQNQIELKGSSQELKGQEASTNSLGSRQGRAMLSVQQELPDGAVSDTVAILNAVEDGDAKAADELLKLVYDELRRLAAVKMAQQAPGQTLQATALVHEAWLRLVGSENPTFKNRTHFFSAAAEAMRHILIDRARRKQTQRHGGRFERVDIDGFEIQAPSPDEQMLAIHELLEKFAIIYPLQAEVVKLRYFAGMTNVEISQLLSISVRTVNNYWDFARAWLFQEIEGK
ncbi:MAG: sigma-70 family RNA polymerase sigma factor [Limisphaerales bacterium]